MTPEQEILEDALIAARRRIERFKSEIGEHSATLPLDPERDWSEPSAALETEMAAFTKRYEMTQDIITRWVFRSILAVQGRSFRAKSLADVVLGVAGLGIVTDAGRWDEITKLRNSFAHDYAMTFAEIVPLLNQAWSFAPDLIAAFERADEYAAANRLLVPKEQS